METAQKIQVSIPSPSRWGIHATIAGKPVIWGILIISSITDSRVTGTINFRGTPIPVNGYWNESTKQIRFDSPYATFSGNLTIFDDPPIQIRHFILSGQFIMKPPSIHAGEYGSWIATHDAPLTGPPIISGNLPPTGVFLSSNLLYQQPLR